MKKNSIFLLILLGIIISIFTTFILLILGYLIIQKTNNDKSENDTKYYDFTEISPLSNSSVSHGVVKMNKNLENEEFLSYFNVKTRNTVLISTLFEDKRNYECTGTCYCSNSEENNFKRRNANTILNNGLFIILSAITSIMAINFAKEIFQNNCIDQFSHMCSESNIKSEVNECTEENEKTNEETNIISKNDELQILRYSCFGHCLKKENNRFNLEKMDSKGKKALDKISDCSSMSLTKTIEIVESKKMDENYDDQKAVYKFHKDHLKSFCKQSSKFEYFHESEFEITGSGKIRIGYACVGSYKWKQHLNVKCEPLE